MFVTDYVCNQALNLLFLDNLHRASPNTYYYHNTINGHTCITNDVNITSCQKEPNDRFRIITLSDTHDRHDKLQMTQECDIFIHCGDILMTGRHFSEQDAIVKLINFNNWLGTIPAKLKLIIAGNHDLPLLLLGQERVQSILTNAIYLLNSGITYKDLVIWGSPISQPGKSSNKAFQSNEFVQQTVQSCPSQVDILITHGHYPILQSKINHKLHVCGHKHNAYGLYYLFHNNSDQQALPTTGDDKSLVTPNTLSACGPINNGQFKLVHVPIMIDLPSGNLSTSLMYPAIPVATIQHNSQQQQQYDSKKKKKKAYLFKSYSHQITPTIAFATTTVIMHNNENDNVLPHIRYGYPADCFHHNNSNHNGIPQNISKNDITTSSSVASSTTLSARIMLSNMFQTISSPRSISSSSIIPSSATMINKHKVIPLQQQ